jgi:hypothetical protein
MTSLACEQLCATWEPEIALNPDGRLTDQSSFDFERLTMMTFHDIKEMS